jgi:hypothetical protein
MMYASEEEEKGRERGKRRRGGKSKGVWRGAAMDSLKYH